MLKAAIGLVSVATYNYPGARFLDAGTGDSCAQLAAAELSLLELARAQQASTALWRQGGGLLLNIAATLFVGLRYGEWMWGSIAGVVGLVAGQAILRTAPTRATRMVEAFQIGSSSSSSDELSLGGSWAGPTIVGVSVAF